jgi:putative tryptophan/tyrosine transport system substrate-binding protein
MTRSSAMTRRRFVQGAGLAGLGLLVACGRLPWQARQSAKIPTVGYLVPGFPGAVDDAFRQGLRELGYVEGQNILIEYRHAEFREDRIPLLAAELVQHPVDIVVANAVAVPALRELTTSIPIVMATSLDPVGSGWVASLARPGGNVTGLSLLGPQLSTKRLELVKDAIPGLARLGVVWNAAHPGKRLDVREIEVAAETLGIEVQLLGVRDQEDIERLSAADQGAAIDALNVVADPLVSYHRAHIIDFAVRRRLPTMSEHREFVADGGLMAYGPSVPSSYRRAAYYVDKILKGAKPADLPVEQPMTFEFVINLKTAQALGLTLPPHVLLQATEVIQ